MTMPEVIDFIDGYAGRGRSAVRTHTTVTAVEATGDGYRVITDQGVLGGPDASCSPSGGLHRPARAGRRGRRPGRDRRPSRRTCYRRPDDLPDGGVLVVGASASGIQIADELHRSGRPVTVAVGEHVRMPRRYRGRDVMWWMAASGHRGPAPRRDRRPRPRAGRALAPAGRHPREGRSSTSTPSPTGCAPRRAAGSDPRRRRPVLRRPGEQGLDLADLKLGRLLDTFDAWATATGLDDGGRARPTGPSRPGSTPRRR